MALRGYEYADKTYVMTKAVRLAHNTSHKIERSSDKDWIDSFYRISSTQNAFKQQHLQMIQSISAPSFIAIQRDKKENIAAQAIGVIKNGYFGIFNIVTDKAHQRQGFCQLLISGLMNWAYYLGAHTAYVQVNAENIPALTLYQKLGYKKKYHCWYRALRR